MTDYQERVRETVQTLRAKQPMLHGSSELRQFRIGFEILDWLVDHVTPSDVTLETGCGYSTIVFAAAGTQHTIISPVIQEHERVRTWCNEHKISTRNLEFITRVSQDVLPRFRPDPLDLVLIDGCHGFPFPFLDWYYSSARLRQGGLLVVDDTQLRTGWILRDFLKREKGRWRLTQEFEKTAVFEKLLADVPAQQDGQQHGAEWNEQPWSSRYIGKWGLKRRRAWLACRRWLRELRAKVRRK